MMKYIFTYDNLMKLGAVFIQTARIANDLGVDLDDLIIDIQAGGYNTDYKTTKEEFIDYSLQSVIEAAISEYAETEMVEIK